MKVKDAKNLQADRRVKADRIFQDIDFPASVEDFEGWETVISSGREGFANTWKRQIYLYNEDLDGGDTIPANFEIVFYANSSIPMSAYLDSKEMLLP